MLIFIVSRTVQQSLHLNRKSIVDVCRGIVAELKASCRGHSGFRGVCLVENTRFERNGATRSRQYSKMIIENRNTICKKAARSRSGWLSRLESG